MVTRFVINEGKGFLVEIRHEGNNAGLMMFFVSPREKNYEDITENLSDILSGAGLDVTKVSIDPRPDGGGDMAIVRYQGTLDEAKAAVSTYRNLAGKYPKLCEIFPHEKVALQERHWGRKDAEWMQSVEDQKRSR